MFVVSLMLEKKGVQFYDVTQDLFVQVILKGNMFFFFIEVMDTIK